MEKFDSQSQVSHMFNQISKKYDLVNRILSFQVDKWWRKKMVLFLPSQGNIRLLDIATGTCDQILTLMKTKRIQSAVGIDLAENMLKIGQKKVLASSWKEKIRLIQADACQIPFPLESFECVTLSFGIRNIQGNCLPEIYRVLTKGGKCLILEFSLPKNRMIQYFYLFYLRKILPLLGGWMTKQKKAYKYLNQSIEEFPSGEKLLSRMRETGFINCNMHPLSFGISTLYVGEKG